MWGERRLILPAWLCDIVRVTGAPSRAMPMAGITWIFCGSACVDADNIGVTADGEVVFGRRRSHRADVFRLRPQCPRQGLLFAVPRSPLVGPRPPWSRWCLVGHVQVH